MSNQLTTRRFVAERNGDADRRFRRTRRTSIVPLASARDAWILGDDQKCVEGPHACVAVATSYDEYSWREDTTVENVKINQSTVRHYRPVSNRVPLVDPLVGAQMHYLLLGPDARSGETWFESTDVFFTIEAAMNEAKRVGQLDPSSAPEVARA